jgi:DNA-binding response OmpR family regulator
MAKNILVIEDDTDLRDILRDSLTEEGYIVTTAKGGKEGLELALAQHPDLILLDIILPGMDGLSVLRHIRQDQSWGEQAKVVMLTNLSDSKSVAECLELGAHTFLVKADLTIEAILTMVHNELQDRPQDNAEFQSI